MAKHWTRPPGRPRHTRTWTVTVVGDVALLNTNNAEEKRAKFMSSRESIRKLLNNPSGWRWMLETATVQPVVACDADADDECCGLLSVNVSLYIRNPDQTMLYGFPMPCSLSSR